jgi:hypothetical protein
MNKSFKRIFPLFLVGFLSVSCSNSSSSDSELIPERNDTSTELNGTITEKEDTDSSLEENTASSLEENNNVSVSEDGETTVDFKAIPIPSCESGKYQILKSGDKIRRISLEPELKIIHNEDNEKFVCIQSGQATIVRSE